MTSSEQHPPFPHEFDFLIGTALPADSPVARLLVSLGAAANDLILVQKLWFSAVETDIQLSRELDEGESFYMFRLTLSIIWETHLLLQAAVDNEESAAFLDGLSPDAQAALATIRGAVDAMESDRYRGVVAATRNVTSHYPKPGVAQGGKSLAPTLAELAMADSKIIQTGPTMGQVRCSRRVYLPPPRVRSGCHRLGPAESFVLQCPNLGSPRVTSGHERQQNA